MLKKSENEFTALKLDSIQVWINKYHLFRFRKMCMDICLQFYLPCKCSSWTFCTVLNRIVYHHALQYNLGTGSLFKNNHRLSYFIFNVFQWISYTYKIDEVLIDFPADVPSYIRLKTLCTPLHVIVYSRNKIYNWLMEEICNAKKIQHITSVIELPYL